MAKSIQLSPELEIIYLGRKNGLDLYKSATDIVTIRPGSIHIHNGFANFLYSTAEWNSIDMTSGYTTDKWHFITITKDGNFYAREATGTSSQRPTNILYSYVDGDNTGYKHNKQGYYWTEDERIIGAVYLGATDIEYIINNLDGSDEVGNNSRGNWTRINNIQEVAGLQSTAKNLQYPIDASDEYYANSEIGLTHPVEFLNVPSTTPHVRVGSGGSGLFTVARGSNRTDTTSTAYTELTRLGDAVNETWTVEWIAKGKWRN